MFVEILQEGAMLAQVAHTHAVTGTNFTTTFPTTELFYLGVFVWFSILNFF